MVAGYEPPVGGEWDDYSRYIVDGVELQSPVSGCKHLDPSWIEVSFLVEKLPSKHSMLKGACTHSGSGKCIHSDHCQQ